MTTDFRALCARLVHELENTQKSLMYHQGCSTILDSIRCTVVDRARAALAEPEPVGASDAELLAQAAESLGYERIPLDHEGGAAEAYACELLAFARAVLARWGRQHYAPLAQPKSVPTDDELREFIETLRNQWIRTVISGGEDPDSDDFDRAIARAVLARWGRP